MGSARFAPALLVAIALFASAPLLGSTQEKLPDPPKKIDPEKGGNTFFALNKDEVLVISTDLTNNVGAVLGPDADIVEKGKCSVVKGTGADVGGAWDLTKGKTVIIPLERVTQFVVMKQADAQKALTPPAKK